MSCSSFYKIGGSHSVCEDYAFHTDNGPTFFSVADGCSSSNNSDVGARLITLCTLKAIKDTPVTGKDSAKAVILQAARYADMAMECAGIKEEAGDSTIIFGQVINETINLVMAGDGEIVYCDKNNKTTHIKSEFSDGMPFYPNYLRNYDRMEAFKRANQRHLIIKNNKETEYKEHIYYLQLNLNEIKWIICCSDGINTIHDENWNYTNSNEIIKEAFNFKNFNGEFIYRRMNRWRNRLISKGMNHSDDLSVSGFYNDCI